MGGIISKALAIAIAISAIAVIIGLAKGNSPNIYGLSITFLFSFIAGIVIAILK